MSIIIKGKVKEERGLGKTIGFPTINVDFDFEEEIDTGIYAAVVRFDNEEVRGAAHFGIPYKNNDGKPRLEVHLFDFSKDLYGKDVSVSLYQKIRNSKKFSDVGKLQKAIANDCEEIKKYFAGQSSQNE